MAVSLNPVMPTQNLDVEASLRAPARQSAVKAPRSSGQKVAGDGTLKSFADIEMRLDQISEQVEEVMSEVLQLGFRGKRATAGSVASARGFGSSASIPRSTLHSQVGSELGIIHSGRSFSDPADRPSVTSAWSLTSDRGSVTTFADARQEILSLGKQVQADRTSSRFVGDNSFGLRKPGRPTSTPLGSSLRSPNRRGMVARPVDLKVAWNISSDASNDGEELPKEIWNPMMRLVERKPSEKIWELLDDPNSSRAAWFISFFLKVVTILSVVISNLQIFEEQTLDPGWAAAAETTFDVLYLLEFGTRFFVCPFRRAFLLDPYNWPDLLSATCLFFRASIGFIIEKPPASPEERAIQVILLFVFPVVRFLKLLRYIQSFRLLVDAFKNAFQSLPVLLYTMVLILLVAANSIYLAEERSNIPSLPHSHWLALVTMTTVGFGDYTPQTAWGFMIVGALSMVSTVFLAMPVGIVGREFSNSWERRKYVLLISRLRKSFVKWGFGPKDLRVLFEYVDIDGDGVLTSVEFILLVQQLRIGFTRAEAIEIFSLFDDDGNNKIDYFEFLRHIFPNESYEDEKFLEVVKQESAKRVTEAFSYASRQTSLPDQSIGHVPLESVEEQEDESA